MSRGFPKIENWSILNQPTVTSGKRQEMSSFGQVHSNNTDPNFTLYTHFTWEQSGQCATQRPIHPARQRHGSKVGRKRGKNTKDIKGKPGDELNKMRACCACAAITDSDRCMDLQASLINIAPTRLLKSKSSKPAL